MYYSLFQTVLKQTVLKIRFPYFNSVMVKHKTIFYLEPFAVVNSMFVWSRFPVWDNCSKLYLTCKTCDLYCASLEYLIVTVYLIMNCYWIMNYWYDNEYLEKYEHLDSCMVGRNQITCAWYYWAPVLRLRYDRPASGLGCTTWLEWTSVIGISWYYHPSCLTPWLK